MPKTVTLEDLKCVSRPEARRIVDGLRGQALRELAREAGISPNRPIRDLRALIVSHAQFAVEHEALRTGRPIEEIRRERCQGKGTGIP